MITGSTKGNSGHYGTPWPGETPYHRGYKFIINKNVDDEKLVRILQMIDYIYFDEEASFELWYGEEGRHFEWAGEPWKSTPLLMSVLVHGI